MVMNAGPATAVLLAVKVRRLDSPIVGFGLNVTVTPLGRPDAVRLGFTVNPDSGTTVIVDVNDEP